MNYITTTDEFLSIVTQSPTGGEMPALSYTTSTIQLGKDLEVATFHYNRKQYPRESYSPRLFLLFLFFFFNRSYSAKPAKYNYERIVST